jgi:peptidoglycan/LPS O-acetylase OafA/YrhL
MSTRRLAFIDTLRGIAVLLVFLVHATEGFAMVAAGGNGGWAFRLFHSFDFGRMGVVVFFAISGFVIPASFRVEGGQGVLRFAVSRGFRLIPAFWVSIPLSVLTLGWLFGKIISKHEVLYNFTLVPRFFGYGLSNGAYWTLEVEIFFYLACAILCTGRMLRNDVAIASLLGGLLLLFHSSQHPLMEELLNPALSGAAFYFWLHISIMFWGTLCRRLWDGQKLSPYAAFLFWAYTAYWLVYMPVQTGLALWENYSPEKLQFVVGYSGALWIFALAVLSRLSLGGGLNWLGKVSYSFYLLHGPMIYLLTWLVIQHPAFAGLRMELYMPFGFMAAIAAAGLSFYWLEKPCIGLGRRIIQAIDRRQGLLPLDQAQRKPLETIS